MEGAAAGGYVANRESLKAFFEALSVPLGRPVVVSDKAARKQVSGQFDTSHPRPLLAQLSSQLSLVWYTDGQAFYVYDASELKSAMVRLEHVGWPAFDRFLKQSGILDKRYPVRGDPLERVLYVSGPPGYVDFIVNAAAYLDQGREAAIEATGNIGLVRLYNTFVTDRQFRLRDRMVTIPGMATVIGNVLDDGRDVLDPRVAQEGDASAIPAGSGAVPSLPPLPGLPEAMGGQADTPAMGRTRVSPRPGSALVSASASGMMAGAPPVPGPRGAVASPHVGRARQGIRIVAYPDTNSLLIKGTREQVRLIENLVASLDVPKRHIELNLWIIDIQQGGLDQLGIAWQAYVNAGMVSAGLNTGSISTLDGSRFIAQISALSEQGKARIVSRPVVLTQENMPAVFDNNRTFYTKLEGERYAELDQVTYGTLINVLPRLSEGGQEIEMVLNIEDGNEVPSSANDGRQAVDGLPTVGRTLVNTVARVPRGKSLLLGGYTRHTVSSTEFKIPGLGSLPVIGHLFRHTSRNESDVIRIFLIQPKMIDSPLSPDADAFAGALTPAPGVVDASIVDRVRDYMNHVRPAP